MRVRTFPVLAVALCATLTVPMALADEAVTFTNGANMVIVSHAFDAKTGMIRLDLGGGSSIKFPANMIESITVSGKSVFSGANVVVPNQTVAGDRSSGTPAYSIGASAGGGNPLAYNTPGRVQSASERRRQLLDPEAQLLAAQQPPDVNPGTPAGGPVGQRLRMMGRPRDRSIEDPLGTTPVGNGNFTVSTPTDSVRRSFPEIGPRGSSAAAPPAPAAPPPPAEQPPPPDANPTPDPSPDDPGSDR